MAFFRYFWGFLIYPYRLALIAIGIEALLYFSHCKVDLEGRLLITGSLVLFFVNFVPIGRRLLYFLEHQFPQLSHLPSDSKGLILLGGFFSLLEKESKGRPIYNQAAGRIIEFISLARQHPTLPIVFTGSSTEAFLTKKLFTEMGINLSRVTIESQSKNTYDNSRKTYGLIRPKISEKWVLVTSASHLPRSVGLFRKAGWTVVPYPVDYHTKDLGWKAHLCTWGDSRNSLYWTLALTELAGLFNNYCFGKSSNLLPKK